MLLVKIMEEIEIKSLGPYFPLKNTCMSMCVHVCVYKCIHMCIRIQTRTQSSTIFIYHKSSLNYFISNDFRLIPN